MLSPDNTGLETSDACNFHGGLSEAGHGSQDAASGTDGQRAEGQRTCVLARPAHHQSVLVTASAGVAELAEWAAKELHQVRLGRIDQVNQRIRLFRLEPQAGPVKYSPGQWLDMYVPGVAEPGGFTITSAPSAAASQDQIPYLELAVQDSPGNAVAAWLWRPAAHILGSPLRVRVGGSFVFPPPSPARLDGIRRVVFVAGGVGVNPLMSMLRCIAGEGQGSALEVCVVYATKVPGSGRLRHVLFVEAIATLFGQGKLKGELRLHVTRGRTEAPIEGTHPLCGAQVHVQAQRLSGDELRHLVGQKHRLSSLVYICGPPTMTDELIAVLTAPGGEAVIDPGRIMTEKWW